VRFASDAPAAWLAAPAGLLHKRAQQYLLQAAKAGREIMTPSHQIRCGQLEEL